MRFLAALTLLLLAAGAQANGAMGLGLEMFDLRYWFAYVAAMVVLEAWLIGRWLKLGWPASLGVSLLANFFTGVFCGGMGLCAPVLHGSFVGSQVNPNPFMNAVVLLTGLALPSAYVESYLWRRAAIGPGHWPVIKRCLLVHALTVPLGLAILLIPERPYRGAELTTQWHRRMRLGQIERALGTFVIDRNMIPASPEPAKLIQEISPYLDPELSRDELELALYEPRFSRFSMGDTRKEPLEINRALLGRKIPAPAYVSDPQWTWFIRSREVGIGYRWGIAIYPSDGAVKFTRDWKQLGYE
jgi:hypothetical protein